MIDNLSITTPLQGSPSRISWGSVFAGLVIATAVMFTLGQLCVAFGLGLLNPQEPSKDASIPAIALTGAIAWMLSTLLSIFAGSWAAAHLARQRHEADGILHGLLVWGLGIVALVTFGAGASGMLVGGAFSVVNGGVSAAGMTAGGVARGTGSMLGGIAQGVGSTMEGASVGSPGMAGFSWDSIKSRAQALVKQGEERMGKDSPASAVGMPATTGVVPANGAVARDPEEVMALVGRIFSNPEGTMNEEDRSSLVGLLVVNTSLSQEEAGKQVQLWERSAQKAKARYEAFKVEAEKRARNLAAATAKLLSDAAWIAFVATVLGASAAILGGHCGRRSELKFPGENIPKV